MRKWIVLGLLFASGCAQKVWVRDGTSLEQCRRDLAECKYEAIKSTPPYRGLESPIAAGIGDAIHQNDVITAGMEAKGYRLVDKSSLEPAAPAAETQRSQAAPATGTQKAGDPWWVKGK